MVNHYKKIVLMFGLERINDYNFRTLKSLLTHDLKLTQKMQDDYDRIKIADLMEEKFPEDAGLSKLIEVWEGIPEFEDHADTLRKEMEKVRNKVERNSESSTPLLTSNKMEIPEVEPARTTSSSEESKDVIPDIIKAQFLMEESNLPELSATNTCPAKSEPLTSSCLQTPLELSEISSTILATSQGSSAPCSTYVKVSQVSPVTMSRSIQNIQTCQKTSTLSYNHQATLMSPKAEPSSVLAFQMTPATMTSGHNSPRVPAATVSSSFNRPQVTRATVPSSVQTLRMTPAAMTSGHNSPRVPAATVSSSFNKRQVTPATVPSRVQTLGMTPAAMTSGCNNLQVTPATVPSSHNTPQVSSATVHSATLVSPATPLKKPRLKNVPTQPSEEDGQRQDSKQVMVLKATKPFTYDMRGNKRMFHATVATETEFFRVKVFDIALEKMFIPNKVIVISDYFGYNGFLEIHKTDCVAEVNGNNVMNIPSSLRRRANSTPKIDTLCTQREGTFVNGIFKVYEKTVKSEFTYYRIEDRTGRMEVVVYGQLANLYCEPGDKLRLFCFELSSSFDNWQLRSVRHSYMQVIQNRRRISRPLDPYAIIETAQSPY